MEPKKPSKKTPRRVAQTTARKKIHYADPQAEEGYAHIKNILWGRYQSTYYPEFKKFREAAYDAAVKMSANPAKHHKATVKKMAKIRKEYVKKVLAYFQEYIEDLTMAWINEKLRNQDIDLRETAKLAAEFEAAENAPKPKRKILDRKDVKVRSKVNKVSSKPKKKRGKKV